MKTSQSIPSLVHNSQSWKENVAELIYREPRVPQMNLYDDLEEEEGASSSSILTARHIANS